MRPVVPYDDISDVDQEWNTDQPENPLRGVEHESHRPNDGKVVNAWQSEEVRYHDHWRSNKKVTMAPESINGPLFPDKYYTNLFAVRMTVSSSI